MKEHIHQFVNDEPNRRYRICGKVRHLPMYNVIGDLNGIRECYGKMPEIPKDECLVCPVRESCIKLHAMCKGVHE